MSYYMDPKRKTPNIKQEDEQQQQQQPSLVISQVFWVFFFAYVGHFLKVKIFRSNFMMKLYRVREIADIIDMDNSLWSRET